MMNLLDCFHLLPRVWFADERLHVLRIDLNPSRRDRVNWFKEISDFWYGETLRLDQHTPHKALPAIDQNTLAAGEQHHCWLRHFR